MLQKSFHAVLCVILIFAPSTAVMAENLYEHDIKLYQSAIINAHSSAAPFVLISVVNNRTLIKTTGCLLAGDLTYAILQEHGLSNLKLAVDSALNNNARIFNFSKPELLEILRFDKPGYSEACHLLRQGYPAYIDDLTGQIKQGQP